MNSLKNNMVVPVALVLTLIVGYLMLPATSYRIFIVVLATCAVVLAICFAAIIMLNRDIDQVER
jgi:ATP/ADP translocase